MNDPELWSAGRANMLPPARVPKCSAQRTHTAKQLKLTVPLTQIWTSAQDPWPLPISSVKQDGSWAQGQYNREKNMI